MSREDPQLKIRLPLELKEKITESAAEFDKGFVLQVIQNQQATIQDLTDQIKHFKMSFDILTKELQEKKNRI